MTDLDEAVKRLREFVTAVEAANSKSRLTYGDVVYGLNDHELRRSDIRTVLDALAEAQAALVKVCDGADNAVDQLLTRAESAEAERDEWKSRAEGVVEDCRYWTDQAVALQARIDEALARLDRPTIGIPISRARERTLVEVRSILSTPSKEGA